MSLSLLSMELRDLNAFNAVLELGGFTRAAERLHRVQSTVSQAVGRLERELGLSLLERRPDGVRATPAGTALYRYSQGILNLADRAITEMGAFRGLNKGRVMVGVIPTVTPIMTKGLLQQVIQRHPGLDIRLQEGSAMQVIEWLRVGHLDLGIVVMPVEAPDLVIESLATRPLSIIVGRHHPLAGRQEIDMASLSKEAWITYPIGHPGRTWLDVQFSKLRLRPTISTEVESPAQMRPFIEAGVGIAIAPPEPFSRDSRVGELHIIAIRRPKATYTVAAIFNSRHVTDPMLFVLGIVREILAGLKPRIPQRS